MASRDYKLMSEAYQTVRENMLGTIAAPSQQLGAAVQGGLANVGGQIGQAASNLYNRAGQAVDAVQAAYARGTGDVAGAKAQEAQMKARQQNIKDPNEAGAAAERATILSNVINQLVGSGIISGADTAAVQKELDALIKKHADKAAKAAGSTNKAAPAAAAKPAAAPAVAAAPAANLTPTARDPRLMGRA